MRGGSVPIIYSESTFRDKVWKLSSKEEMEKVPDHIVVRSRWVLRDQGDAETPDVRARLDSCESNTDGKQDAFAASTPPLEGKKILFAKYAQSKDKKASRRAYPL